MKPAFSVIFLTTLIGAGQGLFLAQFSAQLFALLALLPPASSQNEFIAGGVITLFLLVLGLFASFFHLGHPERAWRAAAMWRTSWLSREVIALPATMALVSIYTYVLYFEPSATVFSFANGNAFPLYMSVGAIGVVVVFALFICTSMIYACLKFLRQWHSPLTVGNFFLMGSASGCTLASALGIYYQSGYTGFYFSSALVFTVLAGLCRWASLWRNKHLRAATNLQSATGIHHPTIRQMAQGAMGGSFNTHAFIHTYSAAIVKLARRYFLIAGFVPPTALLIFWSASAVLWIPLAAFAIQYTGFLVERWYFFIEAEHPQNAYYQMIS